MFKIFICCFTLHCSGSDLGQRPWSRRDALVKHTSPNISAVSSTFQTAASRHVARVQRAVRAVMSVGKCTPSGIPLPSRCCANGIHNIRYGRNSNGCREIVFRDLRQAGDIDLSAGERIMTVNGDPRVILIPSSVRRCLKVPSHSTHPQFRHLDSLFWILL